VNIKFSATDEALVRQCAEKTADYLQWLVEKKKLHDVEILGPVPAPLVRIKDRVRWHLLLKGVQPTSLHTMCYMLLEQWKTLCSGRVRLGIDVDPESMM
jgi:primosomal protein N' (replication factor Y)